MPLELKLLLVVTVWIVCITAMVGQWSHGRQMLAAYIEAKKRQGFTLIELSIVLVIIGLLVGGTLVGQDMIHSAAMRAQISQIDKFNTAVNTFVNKYNGYLPGDITPAQASAFGLATRVGGYGNGDGNGLLTGSGYSNPSAAFGAENSLFWNDLTTSQVMSGSFTGTDCDNYNGRSCVVADPTTVMPTAKLGGKGSLIAVYGLSAENANFYQMVSSVSSIASYGQYNGASSAVITPIEAQAIDAKLDDGLPFTGQITARDATYLTGWNNSIPTLVTAAAPNKGVCVSNASGNPYNTDSAQGGNSVACSLRFKFQ